MTCQLLPTAFPCLWAPAVRHCFKLGSTGFKQQPSNWSHRWVLGSCDQQKEQPLCGKWPQGIQLPFQVRRGYENQPQMQNHVSKNRALSAFFVATPTACVVHLPGGTFKTTSLACKRKWCPEIMSIQAGVAGEINLCVGTSANEGWANSSVREKEK